VARLVSDLDAVVFDARILERTVEVEYGERGSAVPDSITCRPGGSQTTSPSCTGHNLPST